MTSEAPPTFLLLGPLEVRVEGRPVALAGLRQRALLALLLLRPQEVVARDRLVDELWGERPPERAGNALAALVARLRRVLPPGTVATEAGGYSAQVELEEIDLFRFERLRQEGDLALAAGEHVRAGELFRSALALWRGPPLDDFRYEPFAESSIRRLEELRLAALESRLEADLAAGRQRELVGELQALVLEFPLRERLRAQLMQALWTSDRQADALEVYRETRRFLSEELGIEPSAALKELHEAILRQDEHPQQVQGKTSPTSLPRPLSSFVGRDAELRDVIVRIRGGARLLTLTGPGGSGKTRLALEAAASLSFEYEAGALWVSLAALLDPDLVEPTIAQTLDAKGDLADHIGEQALLLVLDNFEQVIESAPELTRLLERCANLSLLVTSRELLRVQGEVEYPVPPLAEQEAVELFCQRSGLAPSEEITGLCAGLDNLPLALELAAARAKTLSVAQILERLSGRLDLLKGGRDADPRQQTLRATIAWSYDLLTADEVELFRRLSIFTGGCTLEEAEEVCEADLDCVQSLVDKSLLRRRGSRFWMLETIREYAAERLEESGEVDILFERLARHLVALAKADGAPVFRGRQAVAFARLDPEHPNTRAVMDWALAQGRYELAAELVGLLRGVWMTGGHAREARAWVDSVLLGRGSVPGPVWMQFLNAATEVMRFNSDSRGASDVAEELVELAADDPGVDDVLYASALADLSDIARLRGDLASAREYAERSLSFRLARGQVGGRALTSLGELALETGDLGQAERLFEAAAEECTRLGHEWNWVYALKAIGEIARRRGDSARAVEQFTEALNRSLELGDHGVVGDCLLDLALVARDRGQAERAAQLWGAGEALREAWGVRGVPFGRPRLEPDLPGPARDAGAAMSLDDAVAYARSTTR